ncbi:MAG: glycosyltransferase [Phycisphaerales bacterium JB060]
MIFVTVGAQMAFDRMIRAVDQWAGDNGRNDVFAQIGPTDYVPEHIEHTGFLEPPQFAERARAADVIIAHAGMGSIITALTMGKPILVMPRRGELRETRNDHQIATAERLGGLGKVAVAMDEKELIERLGRLDELAVGGAIGPYAQDSLIAAVRGVVFGPAR